VEALMALAVDKLHALREDKDGVLRRHQVRVRVMGDLDRLPPDVRAAAAKVELATAGHCRAALNVCFAYTGRHDMLQAMHAVQVRGSPLRSAPPAAARPSSEPRSARGGTGRRPHQVRRWDGWSRRESPTAACLRPT